VSYGSVFEPRQIASIFEKYLPGGRVTPLRCVPPLSNRHRGVKKICATRNCLTKCGTGSANTDAGAHFS